MRKRVDVLFLCLSVFFFLLMAGAVLLVPRQHLEQVPQLQFVLQIPYIEGILFWTGFVGGVLFQIVLACRRRAWIKKYDTRRVSEFRSRIGLLTVCRNWPGLLADAACVISLISFIILCEKTNRESYYCFVAFAVFLFALCLHCIFNGNIFYYIRYQNRHLGGGK